MIRDESAIAGMLRKAGQASLLVCAAGVLLLLSLVVWAAGVRADEKPYCPQVSRQARQMYNIDKWCASVHGDLAEGRWPDFWGRLGESSRKSVKVSPSPEPRTKPEPPESQERPVPDNDVSAVNRSQLKPEARTGHGVSERRNLSEGRRKADQSSGHAPDRAVPVRGDRQRGSRQKDDRERSSPAVSADAFDASPVPSTLLSPMPSTGFSVPPFAVTPAPASASTDEVRGKPEGWFDLTRPLGAALVFGLVVMALSGALIGHLRVRTRAPAEASAAAPSDTTARQNEQAEEPAAVIPPGLQPPEVDCAMTASATESDRDELPAALMSQPDQPSSRPVVAEAGVKAQARAVVKAEGEVPVAPGTAAGLGMGFVAAVGKAKAEVLGVARLSWGESEVRFGRAEARDLYALLAVSRDGVSAEGIAETLWRGEVGGRRLESAVREINRAMRQAMGCAAGVRFVIKAGERRLLPAASFDVDYWRFDEARRLASIAPEDAMRVAALQEMLSLYRGELLSGRDDLWVLPVRQAAQRQAVDAAERLAVLARRDDPDRAVDVLRLAVERIDPYSEVLWCQLMTIQGELGRHLAVRRSFELLTERLAEIDTAPSVQARQVHERLLR
ncbi:bacterial transcriptional activator domain-containing protein [Nonomuraea sp. NPDC023979]|uniref:AfsR/SARP family transcriptional regulator n=1 Tax=Nonomuraea sp. NPDC023979 TaxID=3154796 RepID=UPI0033CF7948